jgi:cytochrome P450
VGTDAAGKRVCDPDRFLPQRAAARSDYSYMPFEVGPRVCIG